MVKMSKLGSKTFNKMAKKAGSDIMNKLLPTVDSRFVTAMYILFIWLLLSWWCPVFVELLVGMVSRDRTGPFIDMHHVRYFSATADGFFIFNVFMTVAMLLVMFVFIVSYIYGHTKGKSWSDYSGWYNAPMFKLFVLLVAFVFMTLTSVASIINLVCLDANVMHRAAVEAKYVNYGKGDGKAIRDYARHAFEMGVGGQVEPSQYGGYPGVNAFLVNGVTMQAPNAEAFMTVSNETFTNHFNAQKLMYKGAIMVQADFNKALGGDMVLEYVNRDGKLWLTDIVGYTRRVYDVVPSNNTAYDLSELFKVTEEVPERNLPKWILEAGGAGAPTMREMLDLAMKHNYKTGWSLGYLGYMQNTVAKMAFMDKQTDTIMIDNILYMTSYCRGAIIYASGLFSFTYMVLTVTFTLYFLYTHIFMKVCSKYTPYKKVSKEDVSKGSDDESESEESSTRWTSVTPMMSVKAQ